MLALPLGYSYPLLGVFLTMLYFFLFVVWIWIFVMVVIDIFRSYDLSGWAKALWVVFIAILPYLGVFIYLIARGGRIHEHAARDAQHHDAALGSSVQSTAGTSTADQLAKLADLRERGVINDEEFAREKAKLLG